MGLHSTLDIQRSPSSCWLFRVVLRVSVNLVSEWRVPMKSMKSNTVEIQIMRVRVDDALQCTDTAGVQTMG